MELLVSDRMRLPTIYFIKDRKEINDLPVGVPYIFGHEDDKEYIIQIIEYECLYEEAKRSGYPFDFRKILSEAGYLGLESFEFGNPAYMDFKESEGDIVLGTELPAVTLHDDPTLFKRFIKDSSAYVDVSKLKDLNVFPVWLETIEDAVSTNIHNFAVFNDNMYNKKLDGMYGGIDLVSPAKNLIIIDISGSIPRAVSTTCLALAKNLAETFYADIIITGTISTLYEYNDIPSLEIEALYETNGMNNDQDYFKEILSKDERTYQTAIVFGDNDSPCNSWQGSGKISREDGKDLCRWKINKLISFHTHNAREIAGYADWFKPDEVEKIEDWVCYLNK